MKKLTLVAMMFAGAASAQSITIATEGAYAPYNFKDAAGNLVGFEIDLAAELCTRASLECKVVEQAWDGIIPALNAKKYDAIMAGMSITDERKKVISFSRNYTQTPITFAALEGSPLLGAGLEGDLSLGALDADEEALVAKLKEAFAGLTIGVQGATNHEAFMKAFLPEVELSIYDTMDNMVLDLDAGRIDAGISDSTYLLSIKEASPELTLFGPLMTGGPLGEGVGVGIRQEDTALVESFNAAINSMIADGTLSALTEQWFGTDTAPKE